MILRVVAILTLIIFTSFVIMIAGTMQFAYMQPIYDRMQNTTGFNETIYEDVKTTQTNMTYIIFAALLILPFALLLFSLFRREPKPQPQYYGGYYE